MLQGKAWDGQRHVGTCPGVGDGGAGLEQAGLVETAALRCMLKTCRPLWHILWISGTTSALKLTRSIPYFRAT